MKTILIVDDFDSVRLYHSNLLKRLGHTVVTAVDGVDALEKLHQQRVDLVLLDMLMPRMDGHEFLCRIRAMPEYSELPVLVVTSESTRAHEDRFREAGATGFVGKPAMHATMQQALLQCLSAIPGRDQTSTA